MINNEHKERLVPVIAVYDCLIGFKNPHTADNIPISIRAFKNTLFNILKSGEFNEISPTDLSLYHVGDFDMSTGMLYSKEPELLVAGTSVVVEFNNNISNYKDFVDSEVECCNKGEV